MGGPCPRCAAWIDTADLRALASPVESRFEIGNAPKVSLDRRSQDVLAGRGRVRADGYLDHEYTERRELFGTLRVLAVSLAVLAVIFFVTLYLRHWMNA